MDLYALEQKTIGSAQLGELVFADGHWRIKVEIPGARKYLLNLTGELDSPLWRADDDATDKCIGLAQGFQWFPVAEVAAGPQSAPRHLSITISSRGPVVAALVEGRYRFFTMAGTEITEGMRGALVFVNWSISVRNTTLGDEWPLIQIGPPAQ